MIKIKQTCLCRGSGKIFLEIILFDSDSKNDSDNKMFLHATSQVKLDSNGDELYRYVPAEVFPFDLPWHQRAFCEKERIVGKYVIVVPCLVVKQELFVVCFDQNLNKLQHTTIKLHPDEVKWLSRFNYRKNSNIAKTIRNYDENRDIDQLCFGLHYITAVHDQMIVRASVYIPIALCRSLKKQLASQADSVSQNDGETNEVDLLELMDATQFELDLLDLEGRSLQPQCDIMGVTKRYQANIVSQTCYEVSFTLTVPHIYDEFILAAKALGDFCPGFFVVDKPYFQKTVQKGELLSVNAQNDPKYHEWFLNKRVTPQDIKLQKQYSYSLNLKFSIIVPLYKTPLSFFDEMTESVFAQSYPNWELILVNASPEDQDLLQRIEECCKFDSRVQCVNLTKNLGISENTNAGLDVATGDFVCFFDHDDLLEPDILFEYLRAIEKEPEIDLLYCDEDKLMPDGYYAQPFFKPDFSPDLLRNNNYICHMLTIRKTLLDELPRNVAEFDGAQDHNLTLHATEKARRIGHISRVMYHWRMSETSTAANSDSKSYATSAGIKAVQNHLDRMGIAAQVEQSRRPFTYKLSYQAPDDHPLVSIIIPNKDGIEYLDQCLRSILEVTTYDNFEIVIVENNSENQETFKYYNSLNDSRIRIETYSDTFNFSKIINFGASKAKGKYYVLLNNDTKVLTSDWLEQMLGRSAREDVGVVGVKLLYPDNSIQHAGLWVVGGGGLGNVAGHLNRNLPQGQPGYFALSDAEQNMSAVTAACCMVKKDIFDKVNGFTEEIAVAFNDVDFCLKVRALDKLIVYTPEVELIHYESVTRGEENNIAKIARFTRECAYMHDRWASFYATGDPYLNCNLDKNEPGISYYQLSKL